MYEKATDIALKKVKLPHSLLLCDDVHCTDTLHTQQIDVMYNAIVDSLHEAGQVVAEQCDKHRNNEIPGWNEYCKQAHAEAREAFLIWVNNRRPRGGGPIFRMMIDTRSKFKLCLRQCRHDIAKVKADRLASRLLNKNTNEFWKEIKTIVKKSTTLASSIGSANGELEIAQYWKQRYETLLNSTPVTLTEKQSTLANIRNGMNEEKIRAIDIVNAVKNLKLGKSPGIDGLKKVNTINMQAIGFMFYLHFLCVNAMLTHGYMCSNLMKTVLVPIVKDKNENISSVDNYRPIALTTASSKIVGLIYLDKLSDYLKCHDNQFGFKASHSTDMCVYVLKQIISFYSECSSPLFVTYLDASKAFDRVNFYKLFDKLLHRGVPAIYVRLLLFWYTHQEFIVRWGFTFSNSFLVNNGVRQGGVLSPVLFNVYMDGLSSVLNTLNVGCYFNGTMINHLMYADDIVVISPSVRSMQVLLSHCDNYANRNDVKFNTKKSKSMCFKPKCMQSKVVQELTLSSSALRVVNQHNYLGVTLCTDMSDDLSLEKQCKSLYARGNLILRHFRKCSDDVRILLFNSYCTAFYGSSLWYNFKSESFRRLKTAYNRIFRLFFNIKGIVSVSQCLVKLNLNPFAVILRKSIFSLRKRIFNSENRVVNVIATSIFSMTSKLHKHWDENLYLF